jgi:hypothetical protein
MEDFFLKAQPTVFILCFDPEHTGILSEAVTAESVGRELEYICPVLVASTA